MEKWLKIGLTLALIITISYTVAIYVSFQNYEAWRRKRVSEAVECIRPYVSYATLRRMRASFWASLRPFWLTQNAFLLALAGLGVGNLWLVLLCLRHYSKQQFLQERKVK